MVQTQPGIDSDRGHDDEDKIKKDAKKQKLKYEVGQEMGIVTKQKYKK